jgi:hypothetical protein
VTVSGHQLYQSSVTVFGGQQVYSSSVTVSGHHLYHSSVTVSVARRFIAMM